MVFYLMKHAHAVILVNRKRISVKILAYRRLINELSIRAIERVRTSLLKDKIASLLIIYTEVDSKMCKIHGWTTNDKPGG